MQKQKSRYKLRDTGQELRVMVTSKISMKTTYDLCDLAADTRRAGLSIKETADPLKTVTVLWVERPC